MNTLGDKQESLVQTEASAKEAGQREPEKGSAVWMVIGAVVIFIAVQNLMPSGRTSDASPANPSIQYNDDTASYVEISNCETRGDLLMDCYYKNKTTNFRIRSLGLLVTYFDSNGVKLGDRMVPDVDIDPGQTAKSRFISYNSVSQVATVQISSR